LDPYKVKITAEERASAKEFVRLLSTAQSEEIVHFLFVAKLALNEASIALEELEETILRY
jgi:hypothetical protein